MTAQASWRRSVTVVSSCFVLDVRCDFVETTSASWHRACHSTDDTTAARSRRTSALEVLCDKQSSLQAEYRDLWEIGVRMLGEEGVVDLARRSIREDAILADLPISVWHGGDDQWSRACLAQQVEDVYNLRERSKRLSPDDWVLDIGGNVGFMALHMALLVPHVRVLTVEPSPWSYFLLRLNLLQNDVAHRVISLHSGVGATEGRMRGIHYFHGSWGSGIRRVSDLKSGFWGPEGHFNVSVTTLPAIMKRFDITDVGLMKLDCEGCEWEVGVDLFRTGMVEHVGAIVGEAHFHCQHTPWYLPWLALEKCFPRRMVLDDIRRVWHLFCEVWKLELACDHSRADAIASWLQLPV